MLAKEKKKASILAEQQEKERRKAEAELRSYSSVFENANMMCNNIIPSSVDDTAAKDFEDDFM